MSWREFSPGPDLAEQCLVHGQLKQGAMEFCWDAAMSINVLYGACKLSHFNDRCVDSTLKEKNHTNGSLHHSYVLSFQCPPSFRICFPFCKAWSLYPPNLAQNSQIICVHRFPEQSA